MIGFFKTGTVLYLVFLAFLNTDLASLIAWLLTLLFIKASISLDVFCVGACDLTISSTNVLITLIYSCEADLINSNCALFGFIFNLTVMLGPLLLTFSFIFFLIFYFFDWFFYKRLLKIVFYSS